MSFAVVVKNGRALRLDAKTGHSKGPIGEGTVKAAASDGHYVVIVHGDERARSYEADTGTDRGLIGTPGVAGCCASGGMLALSYGKAHRYDARTGSDRGAI